ncbi:hypothetical protein O3G_MSEX002894 [Manduca sexta]|uniref:Gustatory receptor 19 n=1 Tax=Manduca sexta TaxID=7130 RepID=A0A5K8B1Q6_MANSE|nr:hypothetical protein O3G_MSEX002894 [Manduca sexta]CUQ99360.1 TPA: Gustatory receptor 19 [Manduca sexta]
MLRKVNNLFKTEEVKISKPITMIMKIIHILYSLDMGGFNIKTKKVKRITKVLSLAKCLIVGIITVVTMYMSHKNVTSSMYYVQIGHNVIATLTFAYFDSGMTYCDYQKILLKFDTALRINRKKQYLDIKMFIFAITGVALRLSFVFVYCSFFDASCVRPLLARQLSIFLFISFDLILIVYFFIFYTTYWRLSNIVSIIDNSSTSIVFLQYLYKGLIDAIQTAKSAFDVVVSYINLLAFARGFARVKVFSRIKFHYKNTYSDIKRFISYVEARPFKLRACRIIPLDTSLPVHALNIFITYLIIIVQFTHLF